MKIKKPYTNAEYADLAVYCNENNCNIIDKGDYLESKKIVVDLNELQKEKIKQLKENCSNYIYSIYPIHKQLNIINPLNDYPNEKRVEMNNFLEAQRLICNDKEKEIIKACEDNNIEKLKDININFGE